MNYKGLLGIKLIIVHEWHSGDLDNLSCLCMINLGVSVQLGSVGESKGTTSNSASTWDLPASAASALALASMSPSPPRASGPMMRITLRAAVIKQTTGTSRWLTLRIEYRQSSRKNLTKLIDYYAHSESIKGRAYACDYDIWRSCKSVYRPSCTFDRLERTQRCIERLKFFVKNGEKL